MPSLKRARLAFEAAEPTTVNVNNQQVDNIVDLTTDVPQVNNSNRVNNPNQVNNPNEEEFVIMARMYCRKSEKFMEYL